MCLKEIKPWPLPGNLDMPFSKSESIRDMIGQNTMMSWGSLLSSVCTRVTFPRDFTRSNRVFSQPNVLPLTIDRNFTVGSSEKNSVKLKRYK